MKRTLLPLLLALAIHTPTSARAHGSLPITQQIYWQGDTMYVPAAYWGLFVGTESGPWRWICEEAINLNQQRKWALLSDGTFFATDRTGVTVSRDGGCSWTAVSSGVNALDVVAIAAAPAKARVWLLGYDSSAKKDTGLWFSDDQGRTWQRAYALDMVQPTGFSLSADGRTLLVGAMTADNPRKAMLYISKDSGVTFTQRALTEQIDGNPIPTFAPVFIDPRGTDRFYILASTDTGDVLLSSEAGSSFTEVKRLDGRIYDVKLDATTDQLFVAASNGLLAAKGNAPLNLLPTLSSTQCVSPHNGTLYACAWNYAPDRAAIARLSSDASSFTKIFQFNDTKEPFGCPAETPVAKLCPGVWAMYAEQLGIDLKQTVSPTDMSSKSDGCQAAPGGARPRPFGFIALFMAALMAVSRRPQRNKQSGEISNRR